MTGKLVAGQQEGWSFHKNKQEKLTGVSMRAELGTSFGNSSAPLLGYASLCSVHRGGVNVLDQHTHGWLVSCVCNDTKCCDFSGSNLPVSPAYFGSLADVNADYLFQC